MRNKGTIILLLLSAGTVLAGSMSVQVRSTKMRDKPSHLGRVVATETYGSVLEAGAPQNGWHLVTAPNGQTGWLHASALSQKPIVMRAGTRNVAVGVSSDQVALATKEVDPMLGFRFELLEDSTAGMSPNEVAPASKGFNEQLEKTFKASGKLDFAWVDRMEAFVVEVDEILTFREQGTLPRGDL
jgi:hypothetical protein